MKNFLKKRQELKKKFQKREKVFGSWTSLAHPSITEIFTRSGVDFVGIDLEHSTISQEQSQRIIATAQAGGAVCLPRVASHNPEMVRRLLDSGADGMIIPMVQNAQDVENMIAWAKYPPLGRRGFGVSRAQGYGMDFSEYTKMWNASSIMIAQIESIGAVERIDEILDYPELDGVMVGPYDISGSLGIPGQIEHQKVLDASKRVIAACQRHGKACGTQLIEPNAQRIKKALASGFSFVILSSDVFLLWKWAAQMKSLISSK
jgi:2-keto-3-deoxy-L-rhamnonate aldolase RhmA